MNTYRSKSMNKKVEYCYTNKKQRLKTKTGYEYCKQNTKTQARNFIG